MSSIKQLPEIHNLSDSEWLTTTTIVTATN